MTTASDIISAVEDRTNLSISTTSDPSQATVLRWVSESVRVILNECILNHSDIGRSTGSITLSDGTASYDDINTMLCPGEMVDDNGDRFCGWVLKSSSREKLTLTTEAKSIEYDPSYESQPVEFYVDGSNNLVFLPTPDATYTVKMPYYDKAAAISATTSTIPFNTIFDDIIIEDVVIRIQNRDEYDMSYELKWRTYLKNQARAIIQARKGLSSGLCL